MIQSKLDKKGLESCFLTGMLGFFPVSGREKYTQREKKA
jgi:hypothetical protein